MDKSSTTKVPSRAFNHVEIDKQFFVVRKTSTEVKKLQNEVAWYQNIPKELQKYAPKIVEEFRSDSSKTIVMNYYPFPAVSDMYLKNPELDWKRILDRLYEVHSKFSQTHPESYEFSELNSQIRDFYVRKSLERIQLLRENEALKSLMDLDQIRINGCSYKNIDFDFLFEQQEQFFDLINPCVMHGDYCFSNILFDLSTTAVKLIDPRGSISPYGVASVWGDSNYDLAKLRHSVCGLYDFIVSGKYSLMILDGEFEFRIFAPDSYRELSSYLDELIDCKRVSDFVRVLEVLLFVTMIPLHYDDLIRQKAFYLRAVQLYNDLNLD